VRIDFLHLFSDALDHFFNVLGVWLDLDASEARVEEDLLVTGKSAIKDGRIHLSSMFFWVYAIHFDIGFVFFLGMPIVILGASWG